MPRQRSRHNPSGLKGFVARLLRWRQNQVRVMESFMKRIDKKIN